MGKAPKTPKNAEAGPSKPSSDSIDDIFAKPKLPAVAPVSASSSSKSKSKLSSSSSTTALTEEKKKKKKKKANNVPSFDPEEEKPKRVVEVVDPSLPVPKPVEQPAKLAKKRDRKEDEEDEIFRDSRGNGPRRKTEEGFLIFKEAELGIDPEAGGTPLCPFDCDCCF